MEIILSEYVKGLGEKGDVVTVKNGYARNFLIPKGYAMLATKSNKKVIEENRRQASHRSEHIVNQAQELANSITDKVVVIETLAGADGRLFGSVTPLMVSNKLTEMGFEIDRKRISFPSDIKAIGTYELSIDLHKSVKAEMKVEVVAKED